MNNPDLLPLLLGLGMCVIMPIVIVWIVMNAKSKATSEKFSLLHKAVEHGIEIDPEILVDRKAADNLKMRLLSKLQWGIIFSTVGLIIFMSDIWCFDPGVEGEFVLLSGILFALGIGFLVAYFVGKKELQHEISLEEKEAEKKSLQ